jgi:glycosyltransferase involved in cell wall biosynthesis
MLPVREPGHRIAPPRAHFIHVPTPGDHYSPATGSAVITIIAELSRIHAAHHRPSTILVSTGTTAGYPPYPIGATREIALGTALPSRPQKLLDAACGRLLRSRPFASRLYNVLPDALERSRCEATLFIWNNPAPLPMLRRRLPNAHLVLYAQNQLFNTYSPREIRRILDSTDTLICCSQFIADDIQRRARSRSPKVQALLNGVNTDTFSPAPPSTPADPPVILFLGRVMDIKGPDLLLKAAAQIANASRPFKIRIIGSQNFSANDPLTPYEQSLRSLAAHPSLAGRVEFSPFAPRNQIVASLQQATIYVVPSNWNDPCPLTVLEGLACGLPMIVSRRGGIPEEAADAALYFSPPDTAQFATHLATLLDDPAQRVTLAAKARTRALQLSWHHQYSALARLLNLP